MRRPTSQLQSDPVLRFLTSRINYERTSQVPYDQRAFRLDCVRQLLAAVGNPQDSLRIVHVAGTKGKGSTAAILERTLRAAGMRTGLYSSPHLDQVEERLRVDGEPCSAEELAALVEVVAPAVAALDAAAASHDSGPIAPTYFDVVTAMALVHFQRRGVDAAVLEVGLGGRLDSTNVCDPLVSVIASISFDHMEQLGNTLALIAGEKAGIIKPRIPIVSGVLAEEPREVIERVAASQGSPLVQLGRDFDFDYRPPRNLEREHQRGRLDFRHHAANTELELADLELNLIGHHQAANAAVAIATLVELRRLGWNIPEAAIRTGLAQVIWPARIEVLRRHPTVIVDAAHNVASVAALVRALDESFAPSPRVLILGTTGDKDVRGMLRVLLDKFDAVIFTRYWNNPRAMSPQELRDLAAQISPVATHVCADAVTAWQLASRIAGREHLICVTGSFFLAAEMRTAIEGSG